MRWDEEKEEDRGMEGRADRKLYRQNGQSFWLFVSLAEGVWLKTPSLGQKYLIGSSVLVFRYGLPVRQQILQGRSVVSSTFCCLCSPDGREESVPPPYPPRLAKVLITQSSAGRSWELVV